MAGVILFTRRGLCVSDVLCHSPPRLLYIACTAMQAAEDAEMVATRCYAGCGTLMLNAIFYDNIAPLLIKSLALSLNHLYSSMAYCFWPTVVMIRSAGVIMCCLSVVVCRLQCDCILTKRVKLRSRNFH